MTHFKNCPQCNGLNPGRTCKKSCDRAKKAREYESDYRAEPVVDYSGHYYESYDSSGDSSSSSGD